MPERGHRAAAGRNDVADDREHRRSGIQPHRRSMIGEFGDARLLRKFGNVPEDLGGL
jgi:hypothetical protein